MKVSRCYGYDDGASGGGGEAAVMRMTKTIYPSPADDAETDPRAVYLHTPDYDDTASVDDQIAAVLGRTEAVSTTDDPQQSTDHYAEYDYRGAGAIVASDRAEAFQGLLDLHHEIEQDSLGRVIEHEWRLGSNQVATHEYSYDPAGNRIERGWSDSNLWDGADESYTHDGLNRLVSMQRYEPAKRVNTESGLLYPVTDAQISDLGGCRVAWPLKWVRQGAGFALPAQVPACSATGPRPASGLGGGSVAAGNRTFCAA